MKNTSITFDQYRRNIRRELFIQRQSDGDNTEPRLFSDARELDAQLEAKGYALPYPTEWGRNRAAKPNADTIATPQQVGVVNLFSGG